MEFEGNLVSKIKLNEKNPSPNMRVEERSRLQLHRFIGISLIVRGNVTVVAKLISDNVIMDYKKCIYND